MAYCPKCNGEMGQQDLVCPHCGYDFPPEPERMPERTGIAYSAWADVALHVGGVVTAIVCVFTAFGSVVALFSGEFAKGLIAGPIIFFLSLAMLVVFIRVQRL
jgi:hypothetical protein